MYRIKAANSYDSRPADPRGNSYGEYRAMKQQKQDADLEQTKQTDVFSN